MATARKTAAAAEGEQQTTDPAEAAPAEQAAGGAPAAEPGPDEPAQAQPAVEAEAPAGAEPEAPEHEDEPEPEEELVPGGVPVTFHGSATTSTVEAGLWEPEETKHVPAALARKLCREGQALFTRAVE